MLHRNLWRKAGPISCLLAVFLLLGCSENKSPTGSQSASSRNGASGGSDSSSPSASNRSRPGSQSKPVMSVEQAKAEVDKWDAEEKAAYEEIKRLSADDPNNRDAINAAGRRKQKAYSMKRRAEMALRKAISAEGQARRDAERTQQQAQAKKKKSISEMVQAKEDAAYAHIRAGRYDEAKAQIKSIRDIPGIDDRRAQKVSMATTIEALAQRRKDPKNAQDNALKDKLILAAAKESTRLRSDAIEWLIKNYELRMRMEGKKVSDSRKRAFDNERQAIRSGLFETRVYASLQFRCMSAPVKNQTSSTGTSMSAQNLIDDHLYGMWRSVWHAEHEYNQRQALSRNRNEQEAARREAQTRLEKKLVGITSSGKDVQRAAAAMWMHRFKVPADIAIPALSRSLKDSNVSVRLMSARGIGNYTSQAAGAVPALIEALKDDSDFVRQLVISTLGRIGPAAKAAIPTLTELSKDQKFGYSAQSALQKIER